MQTPTSTPIGLLQQIAGIQRMEPGKLCVIGQGKSGPFYNLQYREDGTPVSRYVPRDQVETVAQNTANYRTFQRLVEQYADEIITRTRQERLGGQTKRPGAFSAFRRKKSSN